MIRREWRVFLSAVGFFTRLPVPDQPPDDLSHATRYFPLVGWIVGACGAAVFWAANTLWPASIAVWLSMAATALLTGALHEDGLIDSCDGFGGGWNAAQILAIMKDSTIGAFGVLGIVLVLVLKLLCLQTLPASVVPLTLLAGHSLSRFAAISLLSTYEYVRDAASGKAGAAVRRIGRADLLFAGLCGLAPLLAFSAKPVVVGIIVVGLIRWYLGRMFARRIGGYTGDCLGAVQQLTEVGWYLAVVGVWSR
jgi:adenosylcobinamide-GDP ribazoletransferase